MPYNPQFPQNTMDVLGRFKVASHQNIYEADFEYGAQPMRWEVFTNLGGTALHLPGQGGVQIAVTAASGSLSIRQSRPYHRYQPGKAMTMASAVLFGAPVLNNRQRVGFFDDGNGVFFEQGDPTLTNPTGMSVVIRSDAVGFPTDRAFPLNQWNGDPQVRGLIDWTRIQMIWIEYAWYGAGLVRWGVFLNGEPITLHSFAAGNSPGQTVAWARTGNLPVRYELRNVGASSITSMIHYGVSVCVEGRVDEQRGFTYGYGMALGSPRRTVAAAASKFPVLSIRMRQMGTIEYTQANAAITAGTTTTLTAGTAVWTTNQWAGRQVSYVVAGLTYIGRIVSNTANVLTIVDNIAGGAMAVAPVAGQNYTIGQVNRGQLLPRKMLISSSALAQCEIYASTFQSPIVLTGANFVGLNTLGSANSFAERDVSATAVTGGEKVYKFTLPAGGSGLQDIDLSELFPLFNNIRGNAPDILTLAITTQAATPADVGADIICQEAMS